MGARRDHSAGTAQIARDSGGDSMSVDEASALEETLSRIRQRYALYFHLPEDVRPGQERNIEVDLTPAARRRFADAELRYRRVYMTPDSGGSAAPATVTSAPRDNSTSRTTTNATDDPPVRKRRVAVNEDGSAIGDPASDGSGTAPHQ